MSPPGKADGPHAASTEFDEDADYQLALRLSQEMNGPSHAGGVGHDASSQRIDNAHAAADDDDDDKASDDSDFAYAVRLQFEESNAAPLGPQEGKSAYQGVASLQQGSSPPLPPDLSCWSVDKLQSQVERYDVETKGSNHLQTLAAFLAHVKSAHCTACSTAFFATKQDVSRMLQDWKGKGSALSTAMQCHHCGTVTACIFCTCQLTTPRSVVAVYGKELTWCCAGGRKLLLWILLCSLDEHFSGMKRSQAARRTTKPAALHHSATRIPRPSSTRGGIGFGGPDGYAAMMYSDTGFYEDDVMKAFLGAGHTPLNGHRFAPGAQKSDAKAKALVAQQNEDGFYDLHLRLTEALLPKFERESGFDFEPPEALAEMLASSKLFNYCAELLRNDSLEDATKRKDVYQALLSLLLTLGAHYATASAAIYNERQLGEDKINLLVLSFDGCNRPSTETAPALLDSLTNLSTQSELAIQGAKMNEKDFQSGQGQNFLLLCRKFVHLRELLVANRFGEAAVKASKEKVPALTDVPNAHILSSHALSQAAMALRSTPAGRFKSIISQITTLKTGLPPGIFVRYAESRPDVQKAIIIGPEGTPYAHGMFEFDIFCDGHFPNQPPKVQFKTTNGGRIGFNPNLYADGKVCLSLLGTWQGEPWVPGESTLLQVLISIQAMILCEEPWYNEPGREASYEGSSSAEGPSAVYNAALTRHTVRTAMLDWLERPPALWKDVVDQHFSANADKILQTAVEWSEITVTRRSPGLYDPYAGDELDDNGQVVPKGHGGDVASLLPQLQTALAKYGASRIALDKSKSALDAQLSSIKQPVKGGKVVKGLTRPYTPWTQASTPPAPYMAGSLSPFKGFAHGSPSASGLPMGAAFGSAGQATKTRGGFFSRGSRLSGGGVETRSSAGGRGGSSAAARVDEASGGLSGSSGFVGGSGFFHAAGRGGFGGFGHDGGRGGGGGRGAAGSGSVGKTV
ncbi:hypothetical protein ACEQ8H_004369 [Pleosporales sp. CAS-2024a]